MVEVQQQELVVLKQVVELLQDFKYRPVETVTEEDSSLIGQLDNLSRPVQIEIKQKLVALPSKKKQAIEWLQLHPEDKSLPGQDLEAKVFPMGEVISYRTWNRAKLELDRNK